MQEEEKKQSTTSLKNKLQTEEGLKEAKKRELLEHPSYIELQQKLTEMEEKANQYWDRILRSQAEMENYQRRVDRDIANAHKYGLEKFVNELLPVVDNLERAVDTSETHSDLMEGVKLTLKMFYGVLEKFSVEQIDPLSQPFNPEFEQAVSTEVDNSVAPGTVIKVLQKGYLLNKRLVRPALVVVSKQG